MSIYMAKTIKEEKLRWIKPIVDKDMRLGLMGLMVSGLMVSD